MRSCQDLDGQRRPEYDDRGAAQELEICEVDVHVVRRDEGIGQYEYCGDRAVHRDVRAVALGRGFVTLRYSDLAVSGDLAVPIAYDRTMVLDGESVGVHFECETVSARAVLVGAERQYRVEVRYLYWGDGEA